MADYRELLRRAVDALPENNGAARRQVYEKARSALVGQLRAISPPLPAREITQHRLQLEDCIRQVEQGATDALLGGLKRLDEAEPEAPAEVPAAYIPEEPEPVEPEADIESADIGVAASDDDSVEDVQDEPETVAEPEVVVADDEPVAQNPEPAFADAPDLAATPSDIAYDEVTAPSGADADDMASESADAELELAEALHAGTIDETSYPSTPSEFSAEGQEVFEETATPQDSSAALAAALAAHSHDAVEPFEIDEADEPQSEEPAPQEAMSTIGRLIEEAGITPQPRLASKPGSIDLLIAQAQAAAAQAAMPTRWKNDSAATALAVEAQLEPQVEADPDVQTAPTHTAMSSVREVEIDDTSTEGDPQGTIDRAIQTLDREARGENAEADADADSVLSGLNGDGDRSGDDGEARGGNAVTIFLLLLALLLAGVGGAGYWAWREGYVDLNAMFGQGDPVTQSAAADVAAPVADANGPGNTVATPDAVPTASQELGKSDDRLTPTEPVTPAAPNTETAAPVIASSTPDDNKIEERLPTTEAPAPMENNTAAAEATTPAAADVAPIGGQSLLLEASSQGTTGAVPFSGTVDWTRGADETGQPTLMAHANIPARNMSLDLLIRRNSDPTLPASHLMEVDFTVNESFLGGGIAGLPGVLLKNEELVKGVPLVGASARVVGNSFLFALSAADQDVATNTNLLKSRKWIDLALVYLTGTRAIITLEKDADAQVMFDEVLAAWAAAPVAGAQ